MKKEQEESLRKFLEDQGHTNIDILASPESPFVVVDSTLNGKRQSMKLNLETKEVATNEWGTVR